MVHCEISVITDEFSPEFDEVCAYLAQNDVKYVELRKVWVGNIIEIDDTTVGDAKDLLKEYGLKVSALSTPLLKCWPPTLNPHPKETTDYTKNWQYNMSKIDRAIELAQMFDCKFLRIFGFEGKFTIPPPNMWNNWSIWREWQEAVKNLQKKVVQKGKILIAENDSGLLRSLTEIEKISSMVNEQFGLLLDPGNICQTYGDQGIMTPGWLEKIGPYVKYIHAKDVVVSANGERSYSIINDKQGICNWPRLIEWFKTAETNKFKFGCPDPLFFSVETHMGKDQMWDNSANSLKNLKTLL